MSLLDQLEGNCIYCGDDFEKARRLAKQEGAGVREHPENRGMFLVVTDRQYEQFRHLWQLDGYSEY